MDESIAGVTMSQKAFDDTISIVTDNIDNIDNIRKTTSEINDRLLMILSEEGQQKFIFWWLSGLYEQNI